MSVSGIGGSNSWFTQWANVRPSQSAGGSQRAQSLAQLGQDLAAGNLTQAQADYASFSGTTQDASAVQSSNPFAQQWDALGQALQQGDLTGAQKAFDQLRQTMQTAGAHHGHHHHHGASSASGASSLSGAQNTQSTDPFEAAFEQLGGALANGDLSGAQGGFAQMQAQLVNPADSLLTPAAAGSAAGSIVDLTA